MFDALMYLTLFLPLGFPVVPWLFRARSGRWGIWLSTGLILATLSLFPFLFFSACVAVNCGQGAIAIFMLGPVWIVSAVFTVFSAALAVYSLRQRERRD
jgi:membrane protein implicated in regulation of membrane protease activity